MNLDYERHKGLLLAFYFAIFIGFMLILGFGSVCELWRRLCWP